MSNYVKADGDARCITIARKAPGSYIVRIDHVEIVDATITKTTKGWEITSIPGDDIHMPFRTLKDAKAHLMSWFRFSYIPMLNADHAEAETIAPYTGKRTIAAIKAEGIISRMDYPVPYGRPVTEAHVKICNEYGCVTYVKNGMDMGICPRCGEVTTSEEQITEESISSVIVVAPVEIQIPAMVGPYGYTAHGNTYAVDYNRIHEEMTRGSFAVQAETSTEKGDADIDFTATEETSTDDSVSIDSFLINAHKTLSALAEQAKHAENEAWDRDEWVAEEWTTVAKDLASALANVEWSLNYRASKV